MITRMKALPHNLFCAAEVRKLDRLAIEQYHIPGETLMQRAGEAAFNALLAHWPGARRITVVCGIGNNAGDGYVVARLAAEAGLQVVVQQLGDVSRLKGDALRAQQKLKDTNLESAPFDIDGLSDCDVIIDAMLGTGLDRPVAGDFSQAIDAVNYSGLDVLALDIPSGLHADTGQVLGNAVHAQLTVTYIGIKQGMLTAAGPDCCGEILLDELGIPSQVFEHCEAHVSRIDYASLKYYLDVRERASHKGSFGHVLVIGGDQGMLGAVTMAALAAARSGSGLVSIATRADHAAMISAVHPEIMAHAVEDEAALKKLMRKASVVAIGPGLGRSDWSLRMFALALEFAGPLVVDADALNLLAQEPTQKANWILTPHPAEAARLLGVETAAIQQDRFAMLRQIQQRYGGVCVLKGVGTLLSDECGDISLCNEGNPGMASAGMGDVLTGVIAGLLAQHHELFLAAQLGVCLHAHAGDIVAKEGERGLMATDLLWPLRELVNP